MTRFIWLDDYKIGHKFVDEQHQTLFELANKIIDPENQDSTHQHVMALFKYVHEHFRAEEAIMREIHYPAYEQHRLEHDKLLDRLSAVGEAVGRGETDIEAIASFMTGWLLVHIIGDDMQIGDFLKKQSM